MKFITTGALSETRKTALLKLWNNEYPQKLNFPALAGFEHYLESLTQQSHILMVDEHQNIKGWYFDFIRDNARWFALLLDSKIHGQGFGTRLLNLAKEKAPQLNGWVIDHNNDKKNNGEAYRSPLGFYLKNGFNVLPQNRLELETITAVKIKWEKQPAATPLTNAKM